MIRVLRFLRQHLARVVAGLFLLAIAVVTFRFSPFNRSDSTANPTRGQTVTVGDPSLLDFDDGGTVESGTGPAVNTSPGDMGTLKLVTKSRQGGVAPGIPIIMKGPLSKNLTTDSKGQVTLQAPPGIYEFAVPVGCQGPFEIGYGASASRQLLAGASLELTLQTEWQHRIAPAGSADSSHAPNWPIGEVIQVTFDVHDRCLEVLAPQGSAFPTWRFRTSGNLEIVSLPQLVANEHHKSEMKVRCLSEGVPELIAYDSAQQSDLIDLVKVMLSTMAGPPTECRN